MIDLMLILLIVLVLIGVFIAAVLFVPSDLTLRLFKEESATEVCISFGILWRFVSGSVTITPKKRDFRLQIISFTIIRRDFDKERKKPSDWKKIVRNADELYDAGTELVGALTKNLSIKSVSSKVRVGLSDPAQTGKLIGLLYAGCGIARGYLPESRNVIEPSFNEERLDTDLKIELSLPLFKLVIPLIHFLQRTRGI